MQAGGYKAPGLLLLSAAPLPPFALAVREGRALKHAHTVDCLPQATLELPQYAQRLAILYGGVFLLLGGPIAAQTFDPKEQVCCSRCCSCS